MSAEYADATQGQIRETIARLQSPIPDLAALLPLLAAPLATVGLLPPRFRVYNNTPITADASSIQRHISALQRALLEHVVPAWEPALLQEEKYELVEQYFCPDSISFASPAAGQLALYAYSTLLSIPLKDYSVRLLAKLCRSYPIDVLHSVMFSSIGTSVSGRHRSISWEDCVRDVVSVPAKVANYMAGRPDIPSVLEHGTYFANVSTRTETLIFVSSSKTSQDRISSIAYLLAKLVSVGIFPPSIPTSPAQPSFFQSALAAIRAHLGISDGDKYSAFWIDLLASLPSSLTLRSILTSLFSSLAPPRDGLNETPSARALVKREAILLRHLLGPLSKSNGELSESFSAVALGRNWDEAHARIFACWAAGAQQGSRTREGLDLLLAKVVDIWTDSDHVRHSLLSQHHYATALLLLTLSHFPPPSPAHDLALSPPFVRSVSTYISHLDPSVRRCGMLVAEEVARAAGKTLDFGEWDGDDQGKPWCRQLRDLIKQCDADAEAWVELDEAFSPLLQTSATDFPVESTAAAPAPLEPPSGYDSDDSMTGYASTTSSRSASPTPSELAEIERDPTLRVGVKKVARPVYLAQLGEMVRSSGGLQGGNEQDTAEKLEVALNVAEELIRRKSGYGTELEENTVNLVHAFIGLQDNYDLVGFDQKRQAALNALVVCCPRKAAPTIIEQFFTNQYSTDQRFVMLNALALGARELAGFSVPDLPGRQPLPADKTSFPSKQLPPALHRRYITTSDQLSANNPVQLLLEDISQRAIDNGRDATADKVPELVRERNLRVRPSSKISEVAAPTPSARLALMQQLAGAGSRHPRLTSFSEVAAEFFICPLIHRFWQFLRDEQTREARSAHQPLLHRYRSAGTGLVLSALVLGRMLETLGVLVHAARNAKEWLHVIAPDALELALTVGTRPVSRGEGLDEDADGDAPEDQTSKEAALLTAALELALVVLDGCLDLDGGRSLGLEHTTLLLGTGEWAGRVFGSLEDGVKVVGGGGVQEIRLRRSAAGVVLKVDELTSRWRRSMIDLV
ncbi:telomeric DNA binding protein [Polyporus arcularius HHB13444]|uniref:Telomeric DNA binding protein n=1 Tax=Polyporus arcularius HHB13444 TaxID=1314778 RepID=A0A5C3PXY4_9APHY|nr:telomeric DNA binding protein [Polyporus arcularius HHB13444]